MKALSYSLTTVGMALVLGGVVAVFDFDQPSDVFSWAWWMIVSGWCLAFTGMGMDIMQVFKIAKPEPAFLFQPETNTAKDIQGKIPRM